MTIDPGSWTPIYVQLAEILRSKIEAGDYRPGQMLPSETALMQEYGMGRDSVRQALVLLRGEGHIVTVRGVGSYVRGKEETTVVRISPTVRITARMPSPDEKRRLGMADGVPLLVVERDGADEEIYAADRTVIEVTDD